MGVTSHLLSVFARKPVFGYKAMVGATLAIGALGFMVWGHHMFASGMNPYAGFAFSTLTTAIAVPSAIKTFNWLGTTWQSDLHLTTPMLNALAFVGMFVIGFVVGSDDHPFVVEYVNQNKYEHWNIRKARNCDFDETWREWHKLERYSR
jgi:cytochrome c oxidase subunit 1